MEYCPRMEQGRDATTAQPLPPPPAEISGRWTAAAIMLMLVGGLMLSVLAARHSPALVTMMASTTGGILALGSGVMMLTGKPWARWPGLVAFVGSLVALVAATASMMDEPPGSDVEDMRPILVMGALMFAAALLTGLILLAVTPEPRTPISAGWLPEPGNRSMVRYWDGRAWTTHRMPAPTWAPPGVAWQGVGATSPAPDAPGQASDRWPGPTTWSD